MGSKKKVEVKFPVGSYWKTKRGEVRRVVLIEKGAVLTGGKSGWGRGSFPHTRSGAHLLDGEMGWWVKPDGSDRDGNGYDLVSRIPKDQEEKRAKAEAKKIAKKEKLMAKAKADAEAKERAAWEGIPTNIASHIKATFGCHTDRVRELVKLIFAEVRRVK